MSNEFQLKPKKEVFINYHFLIFLLISTTIILIAYIITKIFIEIKILYFILAIAIINLIVFYSLSVQYKKELYIFSPNKILRKRGGIFFESETELLIKNITHVGMRLPFIENKLFKTGKIGIESAGSGGTEVLLKNIEHPEKIYELIEKVMKKHGFSLSKNKLVQKEKPSILGAIFETLSIYLGTIFVILIFANPLYLITSQTINPLLIKIVLPLLIIGILTAGILRFMDLKLRVYNLYEDTITYSEGFLTKNYSFIPIENLSDSTLTQTLIDKIFSLYDVSISCQGASQEIHFKNINNGEELKSNINKLIEEKKPLKKQEELSESRKVQFKEENIIKETEFTAEYKMDAKRTLVPTALITALLIPVLIFVPTLIIFSIGILISQAIALSCTTYKIRRNSMEKNYNFLNQKNSEFTNDKITGVIIKENFIDRWFNTCTLDFWSIGSSEKITFSNIKKPEDLYEKIISKYGIKEDASKILYEINPKFKFTEMLKASLGLTIFSALTIIALIIPSLIFTKLLLIPVPLIFLAYIIAGIYKKIYYKRSKLILYKNFAYFKRGIFFNEFYYSLYKDIKDIQTTKYPFSRIGSIKFNVAGEQKVEQQKTRRNSLPQIISNSFQINYVEKIENKDELIDIIFYQRPSPEKIKEIENKIAATSPNTILKSKPELSNSIAIHLIISALILSIIIILFRNFPQITNEINFLFFTPNLEIILIIATTLIIASLIWLIIVIKFKSYLIQDYRAVSNSGVFYKKQTSIVFNKIDHINYSQGFLNKVFNNGRITIYTAGSSKPELTIKDIKNFKQFHDQLKKYY